jgi:hypothetical protein
VLPGFVHDLDGCVRPEDASGGALEVAIVSFADPGPDVAWRPHVESAPTDSRKLERLEPDVEGEVRDVFAQLATDVIPQVLELFGHGSATALRGGLQRLHMA